MLKIICTDGKIVWINPRQVVKVRTVFQQDIPITQIFLTGSCQVSIEGDRANLIAHHCAALLDTPTYTMDARDVDIVA